MKEYLEKTLNEIAQIGLNSTGEINRLAFSKENQDVIDYVLNLMAECNLHIRKDGFGNIIALKKGSNEELPVIMMGSHLDSVPNGGNFDGVIGILGALAIIKKLQDVNYNNKHSLELVVFMAEESSVFGCSTLGSKAFCGLVNDYNGDMLKNYEGITLNDFLKRQNCEGISKARYLGNIKCFWEMHIEQGCVLDKEKMDIGIVNGIFAPTRVKIVLEGEANHSGATPMLLRYDALCGSAEVVLAVENLAKKFGDELVATVGIIKAKPNVMNVIPGEVELGLDLRSISQKMKNEFLEQLIELLDEIKIKRRLDIDLVILSDENPVLLNADLIEQSKIICDKLSYSYKVMPSGAGHDAMNLALCTPTGMLFVPSQGGISHNPREFSKIDDLVKVCEVLEEIIKYNDNL